MDSVGVIQCSVTKMHVTGDHNVWYGTAIEAITNDQNLQPMLYYQR